MDAVSHVYSLCDLPLEQCSTPWEHAAHDLWLNETPEGSFTPDARCPGVNTMTNSEDGCTKCGHAALAHGDDGTECRAERDCDCTRVLVFNGDPETIPMLREAVS